MKLEEVSSDSDDDLPPLEDNSKHLRDIQDAGSKATDAAAAPAVKKGFFDQPTTKTVKAKDGARMTELKGKKNTPGGAKSIPDFLKVEQDEAPKLTQEQVKQKLVDAMKPTPEMVKDVSANPLLMEGFDDSEVMAAVSEIAEDPKKIEKYKDNKKVQRFYAAMGNMMGSKFEKLAAEQEKDPAFQAAKAKRDAEMRAQQEMAQHQTPPGVILNPGGVAPSALREITPVDNNAESDSDEDMAEIARAMQSNPFARRKPGAAFPPNTKAAPAKAAAKSHASTAVAPAGQVVVGTRDATSCIAERLQEDLLAEKKEAEQKTAPNCPGIVMLPSASKEIGLREVKTTKKEILLAELEMQATSKMETQEAVTSQVVQNETLPPQPLKEASSFNMYDELSELD